MDDLVVGLNEYKVLNDESNIAYTRDVYSCIGALIHRKNDAILMHIEAYNDRIVLDKFIEILNESDIELIELFKGKYTSINNLDILISLFNSRGINYRIYDIFTDYSNQTSIGYNYETKEYYMVYMDVGEPILIRKMIK